MHYRRPAALSLRPQRKLIKICSRSRNGIAVRGPVALRGAAASGRVAMLAPLAPLSGRAQPWPSALPPQLARGIPLEAEPGEAGLHLSRGFGQIRNQIRLAGRIFTVASQPARPCSAPGAL